MHFPRCHSNKGELKLPPAPNPTVMHSPHHPKGGVRQAAPSPNFGRAGGGVRKGSPSAGKCGGQWGEEEAEPRGASAGSVVPKGGGTVRGDSSTQVQ